MPLPLTLLLLPPPPKVHEVFSTRGQRDFIMMRTKGVDGEGGKHGAH